MVSIASASRTIDHHQYMILLVRSDAHSRGLIVMNPFRRSPTSSNIDAVVKVSSELAPPTNIVWLETAQRCWCCCNFSPAHLAWLPTPHACSQDSLSASLLRGLFFFSRSLRNAPHVGNFSIKNETAISPIFSQPLLDDPRRA